MQIRLRFLAVLLALVFLLAVPDARAGWWDDLDKGEAVRLNDVIATPQRFEGKTLTFFCIFHKADQVFAPLVTPYSPAKFHNFAVWPDGRPLWEKEAYKRDYPFLYLPGAHPQSGEMLRLQIFTRIEVTGRVRGRFRSKPCIEIQGFRVTGHRLGEQVVKRVIKGDRFAKTGEDQLAADTYRRALAPDLPEVYALQIRGRLASSLRRIGRIDEARTVEGGGILGARGAPERRPSPAGGLLGDPLPGSSPSGAAPTTPSPISRDLPGRPAGEGPISRDLPGQPMPDAAPPAAPRAPSAAPSPISRDLPGAPAPVSRDLPGAPAMPTAPGEQGGLGSPPAGPPAPRVVPLSPPAGTRSARSMPSVRGEVSSPPRIHKAPRDLTLPQPASRPRVSPPREDEVAAPWRAPPPPPRRPARLAGVK